MKEERIVTCSVCRGVGFTPVECYDSDLNTGARRFRISTRSGVEPKTCATCKGTGEVLAVVTDEPDGRPDWFDQREDATNRVEFEHDTR